MTVGTESDNRSAVDNPLVTTARPKSLGQPSKESFEALLGEARDRMIFVLRCTGAPAAEREDIVQSALLGLLKHQSKLIAMPRRERLAYAGLAALNQFRNFLRGEGRQRHLQQISPDLLHEQMPDPEAQLVTRSAVIAGWSVLSSLPEQIYQVLVAYHLEGLSTREIAEKFGIPRGTVKTRLRTGIKAVRTLLAMVDDDNADAALGVPEEAAGTAKRHSCKSARPAAGLTARRNESADSRSSARSGASRRKRNGTPIASAEAPSRSGTMLTFNMDVFDEFITGTATTWYTAAELNQVLGSADSAVIIAHATSVTGAPSLSVYVDQSADNRTWALQGTAGLSVATVTENSMAQTFFLPGVSGTLSFMRLRITLGGTNPGAGCRLKLSATGRNPD